MNFGVYVLRNKLAAMVEVSRQFPFAYLYATDAQAAVEIPPALGNNPKRFDEYEILKVAEIDIGTGVVSPCNVSVVPMNRAHCVETPPQFAATGDMRKIEQDFVNKTSDLR